MVLLLLALACRPERPTAPPAVAEPTGDTAEAGLTGATGLPAATGDTAAATGTPPTPEVVITLEPPAQLTFPGAGVSHHHATAAFGPPGRFLLTWTSGTPPRALALARSFTDAFAPEADAVQINDVLAAGDKPDVVWDGERYTVAYDAALPAIGLRRFRADGSPDGPSTVVPLDLGVANTPDLAVGPGGAGAVVFNLADVPLLGEGGGMHFLQAFDGDLALTGPLAVMSISAMTTPDVARRDADGAWVTVWTEAYDHPFVIDERYYEVHGRLYYPNGSARSFRADDLDAAWPSRPAVAATADRIAVIWRDKSSSRGAPVGAYGRLFDADGVPLGPSLRLGLAGDDGDRGVLALTDTLCVFMWQATDAGISEAWMRVVDPRTGAPLTDAMVITPPGARFDERPSVDARADGDRVELLVTWESRAAAEADSSVWARRVVVELR